jgi:glycosyltransferase involved in cell wall biosynthesis
LSVVIPAFNAAGTIGEQLEALVAQTWDGAWEVVVADNGSVDDTAAVVERFADTNSHVRLIDAGSVQGASYARNCGVDAALGTSIAFCDADDVVADDWLGAIGTALRHHAFVTGPQDFELLNPPWLWGVYGTKPAKELQFFDGIFPFGPTANLGVHKDVLVREGGFDVSISPFEDIDLCLRLWQAGVELVFVPGAAVNYRYRQDLRSLWKQSSSYAGAAPAMGRKLAHIGAATPARWKGTRRWLWLLKNAPTLRTQAGRARWTVVAGTCVGRITGSVRHRWVTL